MYGRTNDRPPVARKTETSNNHNRDIDSCRRVETVTRQKDKQTPLLRLSLLISISNFSSPVFQLSFLTSRFSILHSQTSCRTQVEDIGIITPYSAQVRLLQDVVGARRRSAAKAAAAAAAAAEPVEFKTQDFGFSVPPGDEEGGQGGSRDGVAAGSGGPEQRGGRGKGVEMPEIASVDGYQGREKEVCRSCVCACVYCVCQCVRLYFIFALVQSFVGVFGAIGVVVPVRMKYFPPLVFMKSIAWRFFFLPSRAFLREKK